MKKYWYERLYVKKYWYERLYVKKYWYERFLVFQDGNLYVKNYWYERFLVFQDGNLTTVITWGSESIIYNLSTVWRHYLLCKCNVWYFFWILPLSPKHIIYIIFLNGSSKTMPFSCLMSNLYRAKIVNFSMSYFLETFGAVYLQCWYGKKYQNYFIFDQSNRKSIKKMW